MESTNSDNRGRFTIGWDYFWPKGFWGWAFILFIVYSAWPSFFEVWAGFKQLGLYPKFLKYLPFVLVRYFSYIVLMLYWGCVCVPTFPVVDWFNLANTFTVFQILLELGGTLATVVFFALGRVCVGLLDYSLDLMRIILSLSFLSGPYPITGAKGKGLQFDPRLLFRPLIDTSLVSRGFSFSFPSGIESFSFQLIYLSFQYVWAWVFICGFIISLALVVLSNVLVPIALINTVAVKWLDSLGYGWVLHNPDWIIGLLVVSGMGLFIGSRFGLLSRFLNNQLFQFINVSRGFGLNLIPGSSIVSVSGAIVKTRVTWFVSIFWRMESLILFTSHLRIDPKQVNLPYWLFLTYYKRYELLL